VEALDAKKRIVSLLKNSSFILLLSIALGLAFPEPARVTEGFITPALMLMMAFSLTEVNISQIDISGPDSSARPGLPGGSAYPP
jgi:hypothetical protein